MPITLTLLQRNALQTKITNGDIEGFYTDLENYGDPFGTLGLGVTRNEGWQGQLANAFASSAASDDSIDVSYGSPDWVELNEGFAQEYLDAYEDNNGGQPDWEQIQDAHQIAYANKGLDADDWFPNKLLNDSSNPGALWADFMANQNAADLWDDAVAVFESGAGLLVGPYLLYQALADQSGIDAAELVFAKNFLNAMLQMDQSALEEMLGDFTGNGAITDFIETLLGLPRVPTDPFSSLPANDALPGADERPHGSFVPGVTVPFGNGESAASPLVLDIDASGTIELVALNAAGSVYWDIDEDGFAEASGWITGGDGLLCIDLNSDGVINDHGELFGGSNGYVTLDAYDTNNNNTITSADAQFGSLRVWVDSNADGFSQSAELHTLSSLGITSIATSYSNVNYQIAGHQVSYQSTFVMNGNTYTSVDAFFDYDNVNTRYAGDYTLDLRTLVLPTLRGYGELPDLHIAMSMDEDLLDMVQAYAGLSVAEKMERVLNPGGDLQDILFRWAGVDGVSPTSRGSYIDARVLGFLETFVGKDFLQGGNSNPEYAAIQYLTDAYANAYEAFAIRLLFQTTDASELFTGDVAYDPITDTFTTPTGIDLAVAEDWMVNATGPIEQLNVGKFLVELYDAVIGIGNLSGGDYADLQALLPSGVTIDGLLNTMAGAISISGDSNDNLIFGSVSVDYIYGNGGADILIGGAGNDVMYGNAGNDTYVFGPGSKDDLVIESTSSGTDSIVFEKLDIADARLWTDNSGYLYVANRNDAADKVTVLAATTGVSGTVGESALDQYVEKIVFEDGTLNVTDGLPLEGTSSSEVLYGTAYHDQLFGLAGNDYLYANRGNDTLIGGAGSDTLYGGAGDDTYVFAAGSQSDYVFESTGNGNDTVRLSGYVTTGVRLWTDNNGALHISNNADASDEAVLYAGTTGASGTIYETAIGSYFEQINFDDSTTWSLAAGLTLKGSSSAEGLYGSQYGDQIEGMDGGDFLYGNRGNDTLKGGDGGDTLYGGDGNDALYGGAGQDTLYGDSGADTFLFEAASAFANVDTVADFSTGAMDKIDLHNIIDSAFDPVTMAISNFVNFTNSGSNSVMSIDRDGTGSTYTWADVATLSNVTNLDETTLYNNGNLLAA